MGNSQARFEAKRLLRRMSVSRAATSLYRSANWQTYPVIPKNVRKSIPIVGDDRRSTAAILLSAGHTSSKLIIMLTNSCELQHHVDLAKLTESPHS